jgi:hypothetical protein
MPEIIVLSKKDAKAFTCNRPWAAISVATYLNDLPKLSTANLVGLLQLVFRDTTNVDHEHHFVKQDARAVLDFVEKYWDQIEVLLVHCEAGLSRSPAIAAAISYIKFGRGTDNQYFEGKFWANYLVYKTILEEHFGELVPHHPEITMADRVSDIVETWDVQADT